MTDVSRPRDDWDRHWTEYAESATQNPAQAMRRRVIRSLLRVPASGARILDIGSGEGELLQEMRARYPSAELCGIDYSQYGVDVAKGKVPGATVLQRDLMSADPPPPELRGWATYAICSEVLEHVDEPQVLLSNARSYLAPGCRLVVTVPGGPMSAFDHHIGHRRHFTPAALTDLLTRSGFSVETATGVGFPLFNLYRLVVVARGQRLVDDVSSGGTRGEISLPARLAMAGFRFLLSVPQPHTPWGWQIAAVARLDA